jgi:hypothetical protein
VAQIAEITESTRRGARGLILAASTAIGNPSEDTLLPDTISELKRLGLSPREVAPDAGFNVGPTRQALEDHDLDPDRGGPTDREPPLNPLVADHR